MLGPPDGQCILQGQVLCCPPLNGHRSSSCCGGGGHCKNARALHSCGQSISCLCCVCHGMVDCFKSAQLRGSPKDSCNIYNITKVAGEKGQKSYRMPWNNARRSALP